jgi:ABC-type transporter Mla subunit MlaD
MDSDPEKIIATLEQAKAKLAEAQRHTFQGLTRLNKIRDQLQATLGRLGQGNPAIAVLRACEEDIKAKAVHINTLTQRIDKAIGEVRAAAGSQSGGSGPASGPLPGPA